ncbi:hypothetical protein DK926_23910 [Rhodococcus sp. Eu-32]|uniref:hypothetical protein n=1 Tax=Rhodococcus sp. Eu-32 TaxID=1017319 RepID=UPI000DF3A2FE|nr:hypothetical protein [Rhodococcus sp. Eu-32]RRQ25322.1 hypothetical protein DK926_23910 [Rhodococcus sp. Eu-32]
MSTDSTAPQHIDSDGWREHGFTTPPSVAAMSEARGWLTDCGFADDLLDDLHDWQIAGLVVRLYEGGWTAFASAIDEPAVVVTTSDGPIR